MILIALFTILFGSSSIQLTRLAHARPPARDDRVSRDCERSVHSRLAVSKFSQPILHTCLWADACWAIAHTRRVILVAEKALLTLSHILCVSPYPPPFAPLPHSSDSLPRVVSGFAEDATAGEVWESLRPVSLREIRPLQRQGASCPLSLRSSRVERSFSMAKA